MSKTRVSLTIDEELLRRVDAESDHKDINRSQMFEEIIRNYIHGQNIDTAVVFCGDNEIKPLKQYKGKPVLSHVLELLREKGVSRAILLTGDNQEKIESHFGDFPGLEIEYMSEDEPRGTAAALKKLQEKIGKTFLAVNGHVIADVDLNEMLKVHRDEDRTATMALTTVEDPSSYGVVRLKGRQILGFEEKPEPGEEPTRLANAGTYIFEPSIFDKLDHNALDEVFTSLASLDQVTGYIYGGKWKKAD